MCKISRRSGWAERGAEGAEPLAGNGRKRGGRVRRNRMIGAYRLSKDHTGCVGRIAWQRPPPARPFQRDLRRSQRRHSHPRPARKDRPVGACGTVQRGRSDRKAASGPRSPMWRPAYLPRGRGAARSLSTLWHGERRELLGRRLRLPQALCLLSGVAPSGLPPSKLPIKSSPACCRPCDRAVPYARLHVTHSPTTSESESRIA
jgi:hypothetical protein